MMIFFSCTWHPTHEVTHRLIFLTKSIILLDATDSNTSRNFIQSIQYMYKGQFVVSWINISFNGMLELVYFFKLMDDFVYPVGHPECFHCSSNKHGKYFIFTDSSFCFARKTLGLDGQPLHWEKTVVGGAANSSEKCVWGRYRNASNLIPIGVSFQI